MNARGGGMRDVLVALRRRLPARLSGTALNLLRIGRLLVSAETLNVRDLATLHETHLLTRRADIDRANAPVAQHLDVARDVTPRTALRIREARVFSQNGEDGIILHLLSSVGTDSHRAAELGSGGWSSNIANLVVHFGFDGVFVDGSDHALAEQRARLETVAPESLGRCTFVQHWADPATIEGAVRSWGGPGGLDVLSIDIDSCDYWLVNGFTEPPARVLILEYNASFGPTWAASTPKDEGYTRWSAHPSGFYYGASLRALTEACGRLGYALVGCESSGVNCFFVRRDLMPSGLTEMRTEDAFYLDRRRTGMSQEEQERLLRSLGAVDV